MLRSGLLESALALAGVVNAQLDLGTASAFAVLAGTNVTNTGASRFDGNVGVARGATISGIGGGMITNGGTHAADSAAYEAQAYVTAAYIAAAAEPPGADLSGQDLGGMKLVAGVYSFSAGARLTGVVVLDGRGVSTGVWIFQIGSTLTTAEVSSVRLINGASACNVFWQVRGSVTIGPNSAFAGNVLALTSISLSPGASSTGGLYAQNGAVSLNANNVDRVGLGCPGVLSTISASSGISNSDAATAETIPCVFSEYSCGYALSINNGYSSTELIDAVNQTSIIPPLPIVDVYQVLFNCTDTNGTISAVWICFAGCIHRTDRQIGDECAV